MNKQNHLTFIIIVALLIGLGFSFSTAQNFQRKLINLGNIKNVATNFGLLEDAILVTGKINPQSSYLYKGSLWVGAKLPDGEVHVTSANGNLTMRFPEWFPSGDSILVIDVGVNKKVFISQFTDNAQLDGHVPLGLQVTQKVHTFQNKDYLLVEFTLKNIGGYDPLSQIYVGYKADFDVMDPVDQTYYPEDDVTGLVDDHKISYMSNAEEVGGNFIGGVKVLGNQPATFSAWDIDSDMIDDSDMYFLLNQGTAGVINETPNDYRVMQSAGPFDLSTGDSLTVFFGLAQANNTNQLINRFQELESLMASQFGRGAARKAVMVSSTPSAYFLGQNYPNPANPSTTINCGLLNEGHTTLKIYDILGREIRTLVDKHQVAGIYRISWNGTNNAGKKVSSGVYFYKLRSGSFQDMKKLIVLY